MQAPIDFQTLGYNDFQLIKKLSRGAQGRTYQVVLKVNKEDFAMKRIEYFSDEDKQRVNFICAFEFDVDMCIIMEFCKQGDLRKFIAEFQKLSPEERLMQVWAILSQIIRALDFMHSQGVIHRDIKPENIFVMEDGSVRLGDFGYAKEITDGGYATMAGTKVYLASEVWQFKKTDFSSDIFSVGIVTVELLTGRHPFEAGNEQATIDKIRKGNSSELPSSISREMKELVTSMISHDPYKRPTVKQIMQQDTIRMYLRLQEEKEKESEKANNANKRANEAEAEISRLKAELSKLTITSQTKPTTFSPKVEVIPPKPEPKEVIQTPKPKQSIVQDRQVPGPITYIPLQSTCLEVVRIDGCTFKHTFWNKDPSAILFDPLITSGITIFEVLDVNDILCLGIADESLRFERGDHPWNKDMGRTVQFYCNGGIDHKTYTIYGNDSFLNRHIALELNMESNPRTVTFYVDNKEQKNYVINIPNAVRFWTFFCDRRAQFNITKFERLSEAKAKHGLGSRALKWGEEWHEGNTSIQEIARIYLS
ncbi:MAG: putative Serine/threonine-protein kinase Nek3 [Streblomastix strix]|uniref:non-specific serine/threonine protein kinase n=1 Tax=Streblomastix strix TaxID=222440 RepID=A0A5J4W030_9EUKA|nr:MAG: putative Serine/threonine-protein kinase Nek3 [Streblomastix strix]